MSQITKVFGLLVLVSMIGCESEKQLDSSQGIASWVPGLPKKGDIDKLFRSRVSDPSFMALPFVSDSIQVTIVKGSSTDTGELIHYFCAFYSDTTTMWIPMFTYTDSSGKLCANIEIESSYQGTKFYPLSISYLPASSMVTYKYYPPVDMMPELGTAMQPGQLLPEIVARYPDGRSVDFDSLKKQILVLSWWEDQCTDCRENLPGLNQLAQKYMDAGNVAFLSVSNRSLSDIQMLPEGERGPFEIVTTDSAGAALFGTGSPRLVLVVPPGIVVFSKGGVLNETFETIDYTIDKLRRQI